MSGPLMFVNQDEDDETAIPVDNISHIMRNGGRATIILKGTATIETKEQFYYVTNMYHNIMNGDY
ncbi:MAG: hypothetical protein V3W44_09885 [Dehalococcoidales bacterium]